MRKKKDWNDFESAIDACYVRFNNLGDKRIFGASIGAKAKGWGDTYKHAKKVSIEELSHLSKRSEWAVEQQLKAIRSRNKKRKNVKSQWKTLLKHYDWILKNG